MGWFNYQVAMDFFVYVAQQESWNTIFGIERAYIDSCFSNLIITRKMCIQDFAGRSLQSNMEKG